MALTIPWNDGDVLGTRYIYACKNYGSSSLAFFKEDAEKLALQLINLGISEDILQELWEFHAYTIFPNND